MNVFESIRKGKYQPDIKPIQLGSVDILKQTVLTQAINTVKVDDQTILDTIYKLRKENDYKPSIQDKANVFAFVRNLKENVTKTKKKLYDLKDEFLNDIRKSEQKHHFSFENNPDLIRYATNVFQIKKDSLSSEDFLTLLELKKQIEMSQLIKYKEENI